jgi:hypothetical protein
MAAQRAGGVQVDLMPQQRAQFVLNGDEREEPDPHVMALRCFAEAAGLED